MKSIKCYFQDKHCHRDDAYLGQMAFSDEDKHGHLLFFNVVS